MMARVRNSDTEPELALRRALFGLGLRGWRCHRRDLPGTPDLAFGRARLAVFVDGAFWHGHPSRYRPGQSGAFWDDKIRRNVERDREVDEALERRGWHVLRIWDFELKADAAEAARRVASVVGELRELAMDASAASNEGQ
jgi:DNA mismatch endonuclease (patch repair protein)